MAAELFIPPSKALDANANPYAGAKWFFYATSTTTPQTVYTTALRNVAHANPVVADSSGKFANIFFDPALIYRGVLKNADESVTLHDIDPVNNGLISLLADGSGADLVGFSHAETYAAGTAGAKFSDTVTVTDAPFNAVFDGATDDTAAFNLASSAADVFSASLYRGVYLPSGTTVLGAASASVRLRKGQTLAGQGWGSSVIDASSRGANTAPLVVFGERSDGTDDPAGQPIQVKDLFFVGGPASFGCIDTNGAAGWRIETTFFSSVGVGINATGGDGQIDGCVFDDGLNSITLAAGNTSVSDSLFYLANQQITLNTGSYDVQLNNNQHEYFEVYGVLLNTGATGLRNIQINGGNFLQNGQFANSHAIFIASTGADLTVRGVNFRNLWGAGIQYSTGVGNRLTATDCIFDGLKTLAAYDQSTTMKGIDCSNMDTTINACEFRNLPGVPITFGGAEAQTV